MSNPEAQDHGLPVIALTVRAHDQGVPVRSNTVKVQVHNQVIIVFLTTGLNSAFIANRWHVG